MAFLVKEENQITPEDAGELREAETFRDDVVEADAHANMKADPFAGQAPIAAAVQNIMSHWAEAQEAEPGLNPTQQDGGDRDAATHDVSAHQPSFDTGIASDFVPDSAIGPTFGGGGGGGGGGGKGGTPPDDPFPTDPNNPDNPNKPNT